MRLDGYIRVSRVAGRSGETFIAPKVQRERISGLAQAGGHEIVRWHEDLDQPGTRAARPGFQAALARVEAGETDGIAVARLDRFARSVADAATALRRINGANGALLSAHESLDTSTSFGRFAMHMMLALAELEVERLREGWQAARENAVARGVHIASRPPTGYVRREDGRLEPSRDAPAIRELFRQRAAGTSWTALARLLDRETVRGPYDAAAWTIRSVQNIIGNRAYVGEARSGAFKLPGAHPAIVTEADWQAAQRVRAVRQPRSGEGALLSGLLRCAGCRHVLTPDHMRDRDGSKLRLYRCKARKSGGRCPAPTTVLGRVVEPYVVEAFFTALGPRGVLAEPARQSGDLERVESELAAAEAELVAYRDSERIAGVLGEERFVGGLEARVEAVEALRAAVNVARDRAGPAMPAVSDLHELWPDLSVTERRQTLHGAIDCVFLRRTGRVSIPIGDRALVLWRGEGPADLPGPGRRVAFAPFPWPDDPPGRAGVASGEKR